jgi:hypothetical protein
MRVETSRAFGKLSTTIAAIALGLIVTLAGFASSGNEGRPAQDDKLQSEFLLGLTLEAQIPQNLGSAGGGRLIVPMSGGTFAGPRLRGTIIPLEATGSCSGPTDLASSTFGSCCKPMMDKKSNGVNAYYDSHYRGYCQYTHGALQAVCGSLDELTVPEDTRVMLHSSMTALEALADMGAECPGIASFWNALAK